MLIEDKDIKAIYDTELQPLLKGKWKQWHDSYLAHVQNAQKATATEWIVPDFQRGLWDSDAVTTIGPGRSVTVEGAYPDTTLAALLLEARDQLAGATAEERGAAMQTLFERVLAAVAAYNKRRPIARLLRLLATLFPKDMTCIVDERRLWQVLRPLGVRSAKTGAVAHQALLRERLRTMLGQPTSLEQDIEHSMFAWLLWEKYGEKPDQGAVIVAPKGDLPTDSPTLSLLPASVQRKGLVHVRQNVALLVAVVREAEQGISRADLIAVIQREAPHLKAAGSAANIISQAQGGLALIGYHDGAYRPTERGMELLSAPDAAKVLQPLLIGRIFGMGQLLLALKSKPEGMAQRTLSEHLSILTPTRKSLWTGGELIQWSIASKLARQENGQIILSDDGIAYADALPSNFEHEWRASPQLTEAEDQLPEAAAPSATTPSSIISFVAADWQTLATRFSDGELSSRLILPNGFLAELHAALHATRRKRFVLLAGLSGTGKTSIARAYAEAYCRALDLPDWRARYAQVAVRPDWTDPTGLLGFVNPITDPPSFQAAQALHLLLEADRDRTRPYFLCLDEMNLARVEHYFAPFLSAMEGEASDLALHGELEAVDNVEPRIPWPGNLFIFGTVNMDESTHPFSDKVLDRAFTFEFWDVDLAEWERRRRSDTSAIEVIDRVAPLLRAIYGALAPARRHFGYRTADELLAYCVAGSGVLPLEQLLDSAVLMKVLPRVRGDDTGPLNAALQALADVANQTAFPRTYAKLQQMKKSLELTGQARFWS